MLYACEDIRTAYMVSLAHTVSRRLAHSITAVHRAHTSVHCRIIGRTYMYTILGIVVSDGNIW